MIEERNNNVGGTFHWCPPNLRWALAAGGAEVWQNTCEAVLKIQMGGWIIVWVGNTTTEKSNIATRNWLIMVDQQSGSS